MKNLIVSMMMVALVVAGCGGNSGKVDLDGTSWKLAGWSISSLNPNDFELTASFDKTTISGKSAINQYNGPYEIGVDNAFTTGTFASTKMAGSENEMQAEQKFLELMSGARRIKLDGDTLKLLDEAGNEMLIFSRSK